MKIELCLNDYGIVIINHDERTAGNLPKNHHVILNHVIKSNYIYYLEYKEEFERLVIYED